METPAAQEVDAAQSGLKDVLRRHADERAALKKRHDKTRSGIPKKDRIGRHRFLEDARDEEAKLARAHDAELNDLGYDEAQIATALSALTLSNNDTDQSASRGDGRHDRPTAVDGLQQQQQNGTTTRTTTAAATAVTSPPGRTESKAARRRRRKAEQEAASQQRIAQEKMAMGPSEKAVELNAINVQLAPKHMRIHPIAADGHCLYSAIAHQMTLAGMKLLPAGRHDGGAEEEEGEEDVVPSVDALRAATADFLLSHRDEYMPFIESVDGDESRYVEYCNDVRSTATWGGHIELQALSKVLHTVIEVYAADMPVLRIGDDEEGGTDERRSTSSQSRQVLRVSFHRKFIHLGEHYNSVVPSTVK